ncbi:ATP-grasp domain-containing protein [Nonomuraea sp. NPDC059194]|uniref:carboxylate--amine ligase n=1 Tax=Nonomuraea sp. NPDC059194 TaxID=3346764 RepID=UPI00367F374B
MRTDLPAIVFGHIELVRPLALEGIRCAVMTPRRDPTRLSRHVRTLGDWDTSRPDWERRTIDLLIRYAKRLRDRPPVFYEWDEHLLFLSRNREELEPYLRIPLHAHELNVALTDKRAFCDLAAELDLPVPATRFVEPSAEPLADLSDLGYPLIIKPHQRLDSQWIPIGGWKKALRVDTAQDMAELWPRLAEAGGKYLAQQYVPGEETSVESYHVYVDGQGEVVADFTDRKIRTRPRLQGHTTALRVSNLPDLTALGREMVRKLGLRGGVAKFDMKRDVDGRLYLMEVNPRFNLVHHPGARAGVNLPALVYADLLGLPRPKAGPPRYGTTWVAPGDLAAAREWEEPLTRWFPFALRSAAKGYWRWDDPMPFLGLVGQRVSQRIASRLS